MIANKNNTYIKESLFSSNDGFFELPYLSNSPELMLDSIVNLPVATHTLSEQKVHTENDFFDGNMNYLEIEDGLWVMSYNFDVKQNIIANAIYDNHKESEYYYLSYSVFHYEFPIKSIDKSIILKSKCWTLYKPKTKVSMYFYKNTSGRFINMVFSKKWAQENISKIFPELDSFFNYKTGYLTWLDQVPSENTFFEKIYTRMEQFPNEIDNIKSDILQLQSLFFSTVVKDNRLQSYSELGVFDYSNAAKAERMLLHHLNLPFIGINKIANELNIAPTKLKIIFKSVFGLTLLQYHKEKNMLLAHQLVEKSPIKISHIAQMTGYESASKFSSAFKKRFASLPSFFRNNQ
jgi:AraC-like DNA-binding protein